MFWFSPSESFMMKLLFNRNYLLKKLFWLLFIGLVDPGHLTIPLCNDPEILGRQGGYGKVAS